MKSDGPKCRECGWFTMLWWPAHVAWWCPICESWKADD